MMGQSGHSKKGRTRFAAEPGGHAIEKRLWEQF
jgi:hypothetical protein